jgi:hypothetical protein
VSGLAVPSCFRQVAKVWRDGKPLSLGSFATAEEAALSVARSEHGVRAKAAQVLGCLIMGQGEARYTYPASG